MIGVLFFDVRNILLFPDIGKMPALYGRSRCRVASLAELAERASQL